MFRHRPSTSKLSAHAMAAMQVMGADRMAELPVATRVNHQIWQRQTEGTAVRIGGHFRNAGDSSLVRVLNTTDGGEVQVVFESSMGAENIAGFVEVVGTKSSATSLALAGLIQFKSAVDVELWDGSVMAMHSI